MLDKLFLQLHSLRREFAVDPEGMLRQVPALGFDGVELVQTYGWPVARWRELLAETGLSIVAAHTQLEPLETGLDALTGFYAELGVRQLVVTALPRAPQSTQRFHDGARRLNAVARRLAGAGFALAYHHHSYELEFLTEKPAVCGMDILLAETDPALVRLEADTHWLESSGHDAQSFLRQHRERVSLVHAKDFRRRDREDVPAGEGDVDFAEIVPLCRAEGWPLVLEYERGEAIRSVQRGAAYLRGLCDAGGAAKPTPSHPPRGRRTDA